MCFSAPASFIASGAIGSVSVMTLKKKRLPSETPFAAIPLLFALQQLVEGILWLSLGTAGVETVLTYIYVTFAYVLWPIFTPFAVYALEPSVQRKKLLRIFIAAGLVVGLFFLFLIVVYPVNANIILHSIFYHINLVGYYEIIALLYLSATSFVCLFSTEKIIKIFGVTLLLSFLAAYFIYNQGLASVWCFFAAILSVIIYLYFHFKYGKNEGDSMSLH